MLPECLDEVSLPRSTSRVIELISCVTASLSIVSPPTKSIVSEELPSLFEEQTTNFLVPLHLHLVFDAPRAWQSRQRIEFLTSWLKFVDPKILHDRLVGVFQDNRARTLNFNEDERAGSSRHP